MTLILSVGNYAAYELGLLAMKKNYKMVIIPALILSVCSIIAGAITVITNTVHPPILW